jgi:hypothetical protein
VRTPTRRRTTEEPDLATTAAQVLNGVLGNGDTSASPGSARRSPTREPEAEVPAVPTELLRSAGLDPARLPGLLGPFLRSDQGRRSHLSAPQLRQLGALAQRNLNARQLASVAEAFERAPSASDDQAQEGPVLSTRELNRVVGLASQGASAATLARTVTTLLSN